jgi:HlyD family secretion protein
LDESEVWIDTVKQGRLTREVHGVGTLQPETSRVITATSTGLVEHIELYPGSPVDIDAVVLRLSNPQLRQNAAAARLDLEVRIAQLANEEVLLQSQMLLMQADLIALEAQLQLAHSEQAINQELFNRNMLAETTLAQSRLKEDQLQQRVELEKQRLTYQAQSHTAQLGLSRLDIRRLEAVADRLDDEVDALDVRAEFKGILQRLPVVAGQQVTVGSILAEVADPSILKAVVRIPESRASDISTGQKASVDTRTGLIKGIVSRIDPAVDRGTVTVDLRLVSIYPSGVRPDLTVAASITLETIEDTQYIGRPSRANENSELSLLKLDGDGDYATRTLIRFGRRSTDAIEVLAGARVGDRIIISDTPRWDAFNRVRIK